MNTENNLVKLLNNITCTHPYNVNIYNVEG